MNLPELDELRTAMETIAYHLAHRPASQFPSPEAYDAWRSRADFALMRYKQRERKLLLNAQPLLVEQLVQLVERIADPASLSESDVALLAQSREFVNRAKVAPDADQ